MHRLISTILLLFFSLLLFGQEDTDTYDKVALELRQRNFKKADELIKDLIAEDPNDIRAFGFRTQYFILTSDITGAEEHLEDGLRRFSKNPYFYESRSYYYYSILQFDHAIRDLSRAMKLAADADKKNYFLISRAIAKSGKMDHEGAYADYMIAYKFDSTNIHVLNNLGAIADNLGKVDDALEYLQRVIDLQPDFAPAYINKGYQLQKMEKHEEALTYFDKGVELSPDSPLAYSNRSFSRLNTGDLKGAMKDVEKSLKLYPGNSYAYRNRAHIYLEMGKNDKACEDLYEAEKQGFSKMYGQEVQRLIIINCYNYESK
ncbi:MAG: tetratricopeptide repeat protein [Bacteroidia bacterium]|nr:tetratricopeptide repeat protein [Bacteroidia bacterium]